jgi:thymidine kinase
MADERPESRLRFFFGTMGSGKSTQALQIHHNLSSGGLRGRLITQLDRQGNVVSSRLGVSKEAAEVRPGASIIELALSGGPTAEIDYVVADETHFYELEQISELAQLVDEYDVDVYAFGLLTSFQGKLFPASARMLELADERSEIQVEARCWCGRRATHNARLLDGRQVYDGALIVVGDTADADAGQAQLELTGGEPEVTYELLCRYHWHRAEPRPTN